MFNFYKLLSFNSPQYANSYHHFLGKFRWLLIALLLINLHLTGCGNSVNVKHPLVQTNEEDEYIAKVYFLRPMPLKYKGIADNKLRVDYNKTKLLTINEGKYVLVKLTPSKGEISTHSKTKFIGSTAPIEVSRNREYRFLAGKTYFILLKRVDEEFRGIFYDPAPITLAQARFLSDKLSPVGEAGDEPIAAISSVANAPEPSPLEPAFPEKLYPGKPYLLKGNPDYTPPEAPEVTDKKNEMTFDSPPDDASNKTNDVVK